MTRPQGPHLPYDVVTRRAHDLIEETRRRVQPPQPVIPATLTPPAPLSNEEKNILEEAVRTGALCRCCNGIHAGAELACPRLASFQVDRDGRLTGGEYWPEGMWTPPRLTYGEDDNRSEEQAKPT